MPAGLWFWLIYVLCLIFGFWSLWPFQVASAAGFPVVVFILLGLLGWKAFGPPIQQSGPPSVR